MKRQSYMPLWFFSCAGFIIALFFALHPLKPFQNKVIAADGFGYYAYLPARFIYHDTALNFKWFDKAFFDNYDRAMSANPTGNFLVPYKDKMINMYYPCLSFFQLPFFLMAHGAAKLLHYPPDGYSLPYQLGVGLSAVFYVLIGLWFCSRLILKLSDNSTLAWLVPTVVFFGSNIFICSVYLGCYTHCYAFCFTAISYYAAWQFFNSSNNKWFHLMVIAFCSLVIVFLRPMNVILLIGYLYFYKPFSIKQLRESREQKKTGMLVLAALTACLLYYNFSITYTQTHTFFVNSYSAFKFYFNRWDHVWLNFVGFQHGILWYTPLVILCFIPVVLVRRQPKVLWLVLPLLATIVLCSFWWYWMVINRTLADVAVILAILLMHVLMRFNLKTTGGKFILAAVLLCVPFYQLKDYQLRTGILNGFNTYRAYYLDYFFRLRRASVFPVDPKTVVARKGYFYDFETGTNYYITSENKFKGQRSATLKGALDFACTQTYVLPFTSQEFKKVKISFWCYRTEEFKDLRLVFSFRRKNEEMQNNVYYINPSNSTANAWDYMEFGAWLPDAVKKDDTFSVFFWNPEKKEQVFIDDLRIEFVVTDGSDEMIL